MPRVTSRIHTTTLIVVGLTLTSCASSPAGEAANVELTRLGEAVEVTENTTSVQECEFITDVPAPSGTGANAIRSLRNQAATLGVNTVLLVRGSANVITRAEGYLCGD